MAVRYLSSCSTKANFRENLIATQKILPSLLLYIHAAPFLLVISNSANCKITAILRYRTFLEEYAPPSTCINVIPINNLVITVTSFLALLQASLSGKKKTLLALLFQTALETELESFSHPFVLNPWISYRCNVSENRFVLLCRHSIIFFLSSPYSFSHSSSLSISHKFWFW